MMTTSQGAMRWAMVVALAGAVVACGGGGGSDAPAPAPAPAPITSPPPPPPPAPALRFAGQAWSDAPASLADTTRDLAVTSMAYDAIHDQLIATVSAAGGAELQGIDPATLETRWTLPAPAIASRAVVSEDGSTAYLALPDLGTVWQVDLVNGASVRSIQVGDRTLGQGPLSLAIRPGHPGTVAVAVGRVDLPLQNFLWASVWDDGVMRSKTTGADGDYLVPDTLTELAFLDADHVAGFDNQTTGCTFTRLALVTDGLQPVGNARPLGIYAYCFGSQLVMTAGRLFTSGGEEIDPDTFAFLRRWPGGNGLFGEFFDTATASWISIDTGMFTGQDGVSADRVVIEEFEGQRHTLRHDLVTDPVSLDGSTITNWLQTSGSRIAFTVYDNYKGTVVLHGVDLAAIAPLGHASFPVTTASGTGVSGISLAMPGVAIAADKERHRLVVALDAGIGPDGNSLAVVDPDTGVVEKLILLPERPTDVKVSTTGSIAYVSHINAVSTFDRVDLVTGAVTSLPLRADSFAIKEDDPQSVAVLDYYVGYTLTAVHDMAVQGAPIDLHANTGSWHLDWIGTNGANELISSHRTEVNSEVARFAWGPDGLEYSSMDSLSASFDGMGTKDEFGMGWDHQGATNLTTRARSAFPGIWLAQAVAPVSSTSAILAVAKDGGNTLSWLQASSDGTWTSTFDMAMSDSGLPTNTATLPRDAVSLDPDQVALQYTWMGELRTGEPARIYIVKRVP